MEISIREFDEGPVVGYIDDEGDWRRLRRPDDDGGAYTNVIDVINDYPELANQVLSQIPTDYNVYESAANAFAKEKQPWDYSGLGGFSTREPFSLNAIWGGSQYAQGRITDPSHVDATQSQANQIAGSTRDDLWNTYNQLASQGLTPPKNPDQIALDFYISKVGSEGNSLGYGPGVNTAQLAEILKSQFLNQPEVVAATGSQYSTPQSALSAIQDFGIAHQAGVDTWKTFEEQGRPSDWLNSLVPTLLSLAAFGPLSSAIGAPAAGAVLGAARPVMATGDLDLDKMLAGAAKGAASASTASGLKDVVGSSSLPDDWDFIEDVDVTSPYYGLDYTPEDIVQLELGTYAGPEQTVAQTMEQMGDLYDLAYSEGFPTSSSAYEGLGYTADEINQLNEGTYSGPEQTEAEVREQMGDELFNIAYPDGYDAALNPSLNINKSLINQAVSAAKTISSLEKALKDQQNASAAKNYQNAMSALANMGSSSQSGGIGIKGYLSPQLLSSSSSGSPTIVDYASIIPKLASILGQRGYKVGGSVNEPAEYVSGPEGKLYARHPVRGFAVGGPGTGQSDDIPTMLSDGEYVFDADTVAALGDGSSKAGADILDKFRQEIRKHKRSAPADKIPPKAKNPLAYLKSAKKSKG